MPWRLLENAKDNLNIETIDNVLRDVGLLRQIREAGGLQKPRKDLQLSDGQETQFSLARLILHHLEFGNKIVLMDEPSSKVDAGMQAKLDEALRRYFATSMVLMVNRNPWRRTNANTQSQGQRSQVTS